MTRVGPLAQGTIGGGFGARVESTHQELSHGKIDAGYIADDDSGTHSVSTRKNGARGGVEPHEKIPGGFLSPSASANSATRGAWLYKFNQRARFLQLATLTSVGSAIPQSAAYFLLFQKMIRHTAGVSTILFLPRQTTSRRRNCRHAPRQRGVALPVPRSEHETRARWFRLLPICSGIFRPDS